jgi:SAM-dependent methyltransferase
MAADDRSHLRRTREFFAPRAAGWDERFPDDDPAFAEAIAELRLRPGAVVVDLGCGTGRALPHLRRAVGGNGVVIGMDATPEMLREAADRKRDRAARLVLADAIRPPLAPASVDAVFAAGLITHVPDPGELLRALAHVARVGGQLALFHPIGRAALAARHGRELRPDELLDPAVLAPLLAANGWANALVDDGADRYLAVSRRAP